MKYKEEGINIYWVNFDNIEPKFAAKLINEFAEYDFKEMIKSRWDPYANLTNTPYRIFDSASYDNKIKIIKELNVMAKWMLLKEIDRNLLEAEEVLKVIDYKKPKFKDFPMSYIVYPRFKPILGDKKLELFDSIKYINYLYLKKRFNLLAVILEHYIYSNWYDVDFLDEEKIPKMIESGCFKENFWIINSKSKKTYRKGTGDNPLDDENNFN